MMPFFLKYKNWIIGILILLLLILAYRSFAKGKEGDEDKGQPGGCPDSFDLNPFGVIVPDVATVNYSASGGKYYSQASGGALGFSAQLPKKEITKEEFIKACEQYKKQTGSNT